jgi:hypothetical protein
MNFYSNYLNNDNHLGLRFPTLKIAMQLIDRDKNNNFIETGTARANKISHPCKFARGCDGGSTVLFGEYVKKYGGHVWTCDINNSNIELCKIATEHCKEKITYVVDDSINFLSTFKNTIDFLYLDSLDGDVSNCAEHQLKEIELSMPNLHDFSIILLDDVGSKTRLSIPFLKENGWIEITMTNPLENLQQIIFAHRNNLYPHLKQ